MGELKNYIFRSKKGLGGLSLSLESSFDIANVTNPSGGSVRGACISSDFKTIIISKYSNALSYSVKLVNSGDLNDVSSVNSFVRFNPEPFGVCFSSDGLTFFQARLYHGISEVKLLVPFDVSSVISNTFFAFNFGTYVTSITFVPGGLVAYVCCENNGNKTIYEFSLISPFSFFGSTNKFFNNFSFGSYCHVHFLKNGKYAIINNQLFKLAIPYDISSYNYISNVFGIKIRLAGGNDDFLYTADNYYFYKMKINYL